MWTRGGRHANFFGGARTAGVAARWSSLDRGVKADFTEPYFLKPHLSLGFSAQAWNTREPLYSADTLGGRVTLRHQSDARARNTWAVTFVDEYQRSTASRGSARQPEPARRPDRARPRPSRRDAGGHAHRVRARRHRATRRATCSTHGAGTTRRCTWSSRADGCPAASTSTRPRWTCGSTRRIGRRLVVANRLQIGSIDGIGQLADGGHETSVPFSRRYFLGGSTSLRGWGRFEVSPLSGFGLPLGGLSMLEWSTELRADRVRQTQRRGVPRRRQRVGAALAVRASATSAWRWARGCAIARPSVRCAWTSGTSSSPIEGLLVNGEPEKRHWRVHFSIGQAF